jgi:hypothetical protein
MTAEGHQRRKNPGGQTSTVVDPVKISLAGIKMNASVSGSHMLCTEIRQFLTGEFFNPFWNLSKEAMVGLVLEHGEPGGPHDFA